MTIAPGAVKSALCLKNRTGYRPDEVTADEYYQTVTPCNFPWQQPVGIMAVEQGDYCRAQITGRFGLGTSLEPSQGDIYVSPSEAPWGLIGQRVYYEAESSQYVVATKTSFYDSTGDEIGKCPGAATIGYVEDYSDYTYWIRIDPRPATARYIVATGPSVGLAPPLGTPVSLSNYQSAISTGVSVICDGVIAGSIEQGYPKNQFIVCVGGPAWTFSTPGDLFTYADYDEIMDSWGLMQSIPFAADRTLRPYLAQTEDYSPIVGYVELSSLAELAETDEGTIVRLLLDVRPANPSFISSVPRVEQLEEA